MEQKILDAASRLWARGGEKSLTMRAVARAAGTTTPTVYERYRDRDDILRAIRWQTRSELFAALTHTHTLRDAVRCYLQFALEHSFTYEVLFDSVGQPPSLHEPWPSFNLFRERVAEHLGGSPQKHTRLMLSLWGLMHGTAMLIIRGRFQEPLRGQAIHSCLDTFDGILYAAGRRHGIRQSGPKWPATLILGEEERSRTGDGNAAERKPQARKSSRK